jgi:hypothetical protein
MKNSFIQSTFKGNKSRVLLLMAAILLVFNTFVIGKKNDGDEGHKKLSPPPTPTVVLTLPTGANCFSSLTASGCSVGNTVYWYRDVNNLYTSGATITVGSSNPVFLTAKCYDSGTNTVGPASTQYKATSATYTEIIPTTASICSVGGSVTLNASSATSGVTYQWRLNSSDISSATSPTYSATTGGNYTVFATKGACFSTSGNSVVTSVTAPTISITSTQSSPATITNGQSLVLTSNGCISSGGTVAWSNGAITSTITVTPSSNTSYTFVCTKPPCVVTSSAFLVNVNPLLPPTIMSSSPSTCTGTSVTLTATACTGGTVTWSTLPVQTGASISVSPSITTNYTATCTFGAVVSANSSALSISVFDGAITSLSSGNWTDTSTWSCNCIPASCNDVTVDAGHIVIIPTTLTGRLKNLTVKGSVDIKNLSMMKMK